MTTINDKQLAYKRGRYRQFFASTAPHEHIATVEDHEPVASATADDRSWSNLGNGARWNRAVHYDPNRS